VNSVPEAHLGGEARQAILLHAQTGDRGGPRKLRAEAPDPGQGAAQVVEGANAALDAVKPGVTCEEVEAAWRQVIERQGIKKESRMGYSTGLGFPPDWGEHTISLRKGEKTVLEPNMTIHLMPGIWMDDWGVAISETFRVTDTGVETLANFPRQLLVKA
jgi:Xaa-Pro dipeptidase